MSAIKINYLLINSILFIIMKKIIINVLYIESINVMEKKFGWQKNQMLSNVASALTKKQFKLLTFVG